MASMRSCVTKTMVCRVFPRYLEQGGVEPRLGVGIESAEGLVHEQDVRIHDQRHHEGYPPVASRPRADADRTPELGAAPRFRGPIRRAPEGRPASRRDTRARGRSCARRSTTAAPCPPGRDSPSRAACGRVVVHSIDRDGARIGALSPAMMCRSVRLAAARRPHDARNSPSVTSSDTLSSAVKGSAAPWAKRRVTSRTSSVRPHRLRLGPRGPHARAASGGAGSRVAWPARSMPPPPCRG